MKSLCRHLMSTFALICNITSLTPTRASAAPCSTLEQAAQLLELTPARRTSMAEFIAAFKGYREAQKIQREALADPTRALPPEQINVIGERLHVALIQVLRTHAIPFQRHHTKDGTVIRILPSDGNVLGRLAKVLASKNGPKLVFAHPSHHIREVMSAYYSTGELGMSPQVILDFNPTSGQVYSAFRLTPMELHELRHWHYDSRRSSKIIYGDITPEKELLKNYGSYADYMSFDEFFTMPYENYARLKPLRDLAAPSRDPATFQKSVEALRDIIGVSVMLNPKVELPMTGASRDLAKALEAAKRLAEGPAEYAASSSNQVFLTLPGQGEAFGLMVNKLGVGKYDATFYYEGIWIRFSDPVFKRNFQTIFAEGISERKATGGLKRVLESFVMPRLETLTRISAAEYQGIEQMRRLSARIIDDQLPIAERQHDFQSLLDKVEEMARIPGFEPAF